jgi:outer membrane receptor protein involved in Fe transport
VFSTSLRYGSGLPDGFANQSHDEPYVTVNLGVSRDLFLYPGAKATTIRFDVVNLFDKVYEIRDGSGIGVFAPQFGARRGFFVGLSQKI